MNCIEHARQRSERRLERGLVPRVIGEEPQSCANERTRLTQLLCELLPLLLVVRIPELPWIGALARRLQFHEPDQRLANGHSVVRVDL